jgi:hypothetical protein
VTTLAFPTNVTGLMVSGTFEAAGRPIEYSVYGSSGDEVRPNPALDTFHEALGLRAVTPVFTHGQAGFSYVSFEQSKTRTERKQLYGLDFFWSRDRFEVSAEGVYRVLHDAGNQNEGGGFVQLVAPLADRVYAIARYETYRQTQQATPCVLWVTGLSFRVNPAVVLKAEWVSVRHNDIGAPDGFLSSISVIF